MLVISRRLELWENGTHWEREYLTEEGEFDRDFLLADLIPDEEASDRLHSLRQLEGYPYPLITLAVSDGDIDAITSHRLRRYAVLFFLLPLETPVCVVADRYEEEGYYDEAAFLRGEPG